MEDGKFKMKVLLKLDPSVNSSSLLSGFIRTLSAASIMSFALCVFAEGEYDKYTGQGEAVISSTNDKYKGEFVDGKLHGVGIYTFSNGHVYKGEFLNGVIHGMGVFKWTSGARYEGEFKNGMLNGLGILTAPGNGKYAGGFLDNMKHGQGEYYYDNGDYYKGEFKNDKKHGFGIYRWDSGEKYIGHYSSNKRAQTGSFNKVDIDPEMLIEVNVDIVNITTGTEE